MKDTLKNLQGVIDSLEAMITKYEKGIEENKAREARLNEQDEGLVAKATELNSRENAVKRVEDVIVLKEKSERARQEAQDLFDALHKEQNEFYKFVNSEKARIAKENEALSVSKKKNEAETAMVEKEWALLRAEQKTWKENFYKEIKGKLN